MSELAAPFSLRDFLQRILPTVIASCLFIPFCPPLNKMISFESLILGSALLSYLIESPVSQIVSLIYDKLPKSKSLYKRSRWLSNNWSYDTLFYSLSNEDREYLYLTSGYVHFYKTVSLYLLIFSFVNLVLMIESIYPFCPVDNMWSKLKAVQTPILGQHELPSLPLFLASLTLCYYTFKDYILEFEVLFLEGGAYPSMAKRYHLEKGNIASGIWGTVYQSGNVLAGEKVVLQKGEITVAEVNTDDQGRFQFVEKFAESVAAVCTLKVREKSVYLALNSKKVPDFRIEIL